MSLPNKRRHNSKPRKKRGCLHALKVLLLTIVGAVLIVIAVPFAINGWVCATTAGQIKPQEEVVERSAEIDPQAIVVFGAGINYDGSPSTVLKDRLDVAIELYNAGVAPKIIMSGDNKDASYNEVMAMCNYAIKQGVNEDDIFCDHAGLSTYDTVYRLKYVFNVSSCVFVTQEYHLYRALYDANSFGITTWGVSCDRHDYKDMESYEQREFLARIANFWSVLTNEQPEKLSSPVSLNQSGTVTQWW